MRSVSVAQSVIFPSRLSRMVRRKPCLQSSRPTPSGSRADLPNHRLALPLDVALDAIASGRDHVRGGRRQIGILLVVGEVLAQVESVLGDDAVPGEAHAEQLRGEVDQFAGGRGLVAGQGGAGADAAVTAGLQVQLGPQAPEQAGHVAALGAVVGVQLVEDDVADGVGAGVLPQLAVLGTEHEEVEHLVVGQQDVRRVLAEDFPVGDDVVGPHRPRRRPRRRRTGLPSPGP